MNILLIDGTNLVIRYAISIVQRINRQPATIDIDTVLPEVAEEAMEITESAIRACALSYAGADHVIVALDSSESWRRGEYREYKAGRAANTLPWSNRLHRFLSTRGWCCARSLGFEADDIIATLVARAAKAEIHTAVLSSDNDLLQLASLFCDVWQFGKERQGEARFVKRTMEYVRDRYKISSVAKLPAYKALVGDPGDNLPGVAGIGPVKAVRLLDTPNFEQTLRTDQKATYDMMLRLVTLREDVPLDPITPSQCRIPGTAQGAKP